MEIYSCNSDTVRVFNIIIPIESSYVLKHKIAPKLEKDSREIYFRESENSLIVTVNILNDTLKVIVDDDTRDKRLIKVAREKLKDLGIDSEIITHLFEGKKNRSIIGYARAHFSSYYEAGPVEKLALTLRDKDLVPCPQLC